MRCFIEMMKMIAHQERCVVHIILTINFIHLNCSSLSYELLNIQKCPVAKKKSVKSFFDVIVISKHTCIRGQHTPRIIRFCIQTDLRSLFRSSMIWGHRAIGAQTPCCLSGVTHGLAWNKTKKIENCVNFWLKQCTSYIHLPR